MNNPVWYTPKQVAELVQTSADRVTDMIASGELAAVNIGRKGAKRPTWRISAEALEQWMAGRTTMPKPKPAKRKRSNYVPTYYY